MSSRRLKLSIAVCLSISALASMTSGVMAEQTITEFAKTEIMNGNPPTFRDDLKKGGIWDSATKTYNFSKNSVFSNKFKGIESKDADVTIKADGAELTFNHVKSNMSIRAIKGSESSRGWREWKADKVAQPKGNINITVKKLTVNVDETAKSSNVDTAALAASSHRKDDTTVKVNIKGDVDFNVKNNYWTDSTKARETVTGGIVAVNDADVTINGNAKIHVEVPNQGVRGTYYFVGHYFVNGIYAGLNYIGEKQGPKVHITGDVDIDGDGTGVQANSRSNITIDGGGRIATKDTIDFEHYAIVAEESTVNMNSKVDEHGNLTQSNGHKVEILGNIGLFNREADRDTLTYGNTPTKVNLALSTPDSSMKGVVINHYAEVDRTNPNPDKAEIRKNTGMNLLLENKATWNNVNYGRPFEGYNGVGNFTGSKIKTLIGGATADTAGTILQNDTKPITVDTLSGAMNVMYSHANQGTEDSDYTGGNFIVKQAKENSSVTLLTDANNINMKDTASVEKALMALGKKLKYEESASNMKHLTGKVGIAEGLTSSSATLVQGALTYTDDHLGFYVPGSAFNSVQTGNYETKVMKDERLGRTAINVLWADRFRNSHQFVGDNEFNVRMSHGKRTLDDGYHTNYNEVELSYGKQVTPKADVMGSVSYLSGNNDSESKDKVYTGKVQGNYQLTRHDSIGLALGVGRIEHTMKSVDSLDKLTSGTYTTNAVGTAVKYTHESTVNDWTVYSSVLASASKIPGNTYSAVKDKQVLSVHQNDYTSLVLGGMVSATKAFHHGRIYGSLGLFHEFNGDINTSYTADDGGNKTTQYNGKMTWAQINLGASYQVANGTNVYIDYDKSFGSGDRASWNINGGLKFMI